MRPSHAGDRPSGVPSRGHRLTPEGPLTDRCLVCEALLDPAAPGVPVRRTAAGLALLLPVCEEHEDSAARHLDDLLDGVRRALVREASTRVRPHEDVAQIRSWAQAAGLPVAAAGRLSGSLLAAYRAAHRVPA